MSVASRRRAERLPALLQGLWANPRIHDFALQGLVLLLVLVLVGEMAGNVRANIEAQNIATGFGFLDDTAGFAVSQSLIAYSEEDTYGRLLLVSILNTLLVAVIGLLCASVIGFVIGLARLSSNWLVARLSAAYIEIMRNVPLLLHLFFWYYAIFITNLPRPRDSIDFFGMVFFHQRGINMPAPVFNDKSAAFFWAVALALVVIVLVGRWAKRRQIATGRTFPVYATGTALILGLPALVVLVLGAPLSLSLPQLQTFNFTGGLVISPELCALAIALSVYTAAFIAEIVRAGILSVSRGQREAAQSLGLSQPLTLRLVIVPQALRVIIPPLISQYLNLVKNSSLAAAIAYPDIVSAFAGTALNQIGQAIEIIFITMCLYLSFSLTISLFMNWYNARIVRVHR